MGRPSESVLWCSGKYRKSTTLSIIAFIIVLIGFTLALLRPHWGIILLISVLPIESIIPQNLAGGVPLFTSTISLLGGVVFIGAVLNLFVTGRLRMDQIFSNSVQLTGLLFILWFTVTHPVLSWFGFDRNYVFTFVQLWSLLWLAATVLRDEQHQRTLMVLFALTCLLSAYNSISGGQLATTRDESIRSAGMMSGLNLAARYYVVGFVFMVYISIQARTRRVRWIASVGAVLLLVSVAYTQSRAGVALAMFAILLLLIVSFRLSRERFLVYLVGVVVATALLLPSTLWESIGSSFFTEESNPRERYQSVDENIRYSLWSAGFHMWLDNPISGIGIGQFPPELEKYLPGSLPGKFGALSSHNMYVRVLAETGSVGSVLFLAMLWLALRTLRQSRSPGARTSIQIAEIWFVVLIVIAAGGLLKDDLADKMFWLFMGISSTFGSGLHHRVSQTSREPVPEVPPQLIASLNKDSI